MRAAVVAALCACADGGPTGVAFPDPAPRVVERVRVAPDSVRLRVGGSRALAATALDRTQSVVVGVAPMWSSGNPSAAIVSSSGVVTATGIGISVVTATVAGIAGSATVIVEPPVAAVTITPENPSLSPGDSIRLTAVARDASGGPLAERPIAWTSGNAAVATVSEGGMVKALDAGVAVISAMSEGVTAVTTVAVIPPVASVVISPDSMRLAPGEVVQMAAEPRDAAGRVLAGRDVVWSSSDTAVAAVTTGGRVTAIRDGRTLITATSETAHASAAAVVSAPVHSVDVSPSPLTLEPGQSRQMHAEVRDATGTLLHGRDISWLSENEGTATVTEDGLVTAVAPGAAVIVAQSERRGGAALVTVRAPAPPPPVRLDITPDSVLLQPGVTVQLTAVPRDAAGNALSGLVVTWVSTDTTVARVSAAGVVTAAGDGTARITGIVGPVTGSVAIVVVTPVARIVMAPATGTVAPGGELQLVATPLDAGGRPLAGRSMRWSVSDPAVATVTASGRVTGVADGIATITADCDGVSASASVSVVTSAASVSVTPARDTMIPGATRQLAAEVRDAAGRALAGRTVEWRSSDPAVASVSASGSVTALADGDATIMASSGGISGTAAITVRSPVAAVVVTPATATIEPGATRVLAAAVRDAGGRMLAGRSVAWSSSNPAVAVVSAAGVVTAAADGSATITATSEGVSGAMTLTVVTPVSTVVVTPAADTIEPGATLQLQAQPRDAAGRPLVNRAIGWTSSSPAVATVSDAGLVTAVGDGTAIITAASEGLTGTATLTVFTPVASVRVTPDRDTLAPGATLQLEVETRDRRSSLLAGRPVAWSSGNTAVATVSDSGAVRAVADGTALIVAQSEDIADTATIVVHTPVALVELTPALDTIAPDSTRTLSAVVRDAAGNALSGRTLTWTSLTPGVATVSASGVVRGVTEGHAAIIAASEGVADTASVTVLTPVVSLLLTAPIPALEATQAMALTVQARGPGQVPLAGRRITWTSGNAGVAMVSDSGVVTGVAPGTVTITARSGSATASVALTITLPPPVRDECAAPAAGWIWCDDFEADRTSSYFEYESAGDSFLRAADVGTAKSAGMRARFAAGQVNAGNLKVAFGRTPGTYFTPVDGGTTDRRELFWRVYVRTEPGWTGGSGEKLSRATSFAGSAWEQAMIAHVWGAASNDPRLSIDPASGTTEAGDLVTTSYNDFPNLRWPGVATTPNAWFDAAHAGQWLCVEARARLNDPELANGVFELWVNGERQAQRTGINWVGNFDEYGLNAVMLENYWNSGSPKAQERYFDNFVVSTQPIGCNGAPMPVPTPAGSGPSVDAISVTPDAASLMPGDSVQLTAALRAAGAPVNGRYARWSSSAPAVARVTHSGRVYGIGPGTATITGRAGGVTATSAVSVGMISTACANEPPGMTTISDQPWDAAPPTLPAVSAGWGFDQGRANFSIVNDPTAPRSAPNVAAARFPTSLEGGYEPFSIEAPFGRKYTTVYQCVWLKHSANWTFSGNLSAKVGFYRGDSTNHGFRFGSHDAGGDKMFFEFFLQQGAGYRDVRTSHQSVPVGVWRKYEVLVVGNTPGLADGRLQVWVNGHLVHEETNMAYWNATQTPGFHSWAWEPTYGGGFNSPVREMFMYVDHWYVSVK